MAEGVLRKIADRKRHDVAERLDGASVDPEPTRRSLRAVLARPGARFVMEVKKASPSGHRSAIGVIEATEAYAPFADAISVLTDSPYFGGSLDDLRTVRERFDGPILAKDFIVDPRQVAEARVHGADAVLAILALLSDDEAAAVMAEASRLRMDVVVEVHDEFELDRAIALRGAVIGINNRDLRTLETDLGVTERLAARAPRDRIVISESGIRGRVDVERLCSQVDAFLVGSSLMASDDIGQAARTLVHGRVKICGLTRADDAALIADAGATHAGIIFADSSPRKVADPYPVATAARRHGAKTVGVFQDQEASFVARQAHELNLDAVQLHGQESGLERLRRQLPPQCEIWAACGVAGEIEPERAGADRILYDTRDGASTGGTGRPFEWSLVATRPHLGRAMLAGGIGPKNARAAQRVGSYGIDVGSGVEAAAGIKDGLKVQALFDSLRPSCRRSAACG